MKNNITKFNKCANCGACYNICPKEAISINEKNMFYECVVDNEKCIDCGKCVLVCPVNNPKSKQSLKSAIGGWNKDKDVVFNSSSGGAFSIISDYVLKKSGIVYGAVYSKDKHRVVFDSTNNFSLDEIRRSKYVESNIQDTFKKIKADLLDERTVLFAGAPCQVAGLKNYLSKEYDNLITCDFACGGMASHSIYDAYLKLLEKKYGSRIESVNFRPKITEWGTHSILIKLSNGKTYHKMAYLDPYFYAFVYKRVSVRDNCLNCQFSNNHYSDIILADFWKWKNLSKLENDKTGISLILSNSQKGELILKIVKQNMVYEDLCLDEASYNCKESSVNVGYYKTRKVFFDKYYAKGILAASKSVGLPTGIKAIKSIIRWRKIKSQENNRCM